MSERYTYSSCYRIILLGCSPITILKQRQNRAFWRFFLAQGLLAAVEGTLNYADLCTLAKRVEFASQNLII
jgi:hypothetical protein